MCVTTCIYIAVTQPENCYHLFTDGEDYTGGTKELVFEAGDGVGVIRCVSYSIIDDSVSEGTEDFLVATSTDDTDRLVIEEGRVRVFITDDDDEGKYLIYWETWLILQSIEIFL